MQQAIYNNSINNVSNNNSGRKAALPAMNGAALVRWMAHRWDLVGVLALIGSSAAYGTLARAHLG